MFVVEQYNQNSSSVAWVVVIILLILLLIVAFSNSGQPNSTVGGAARCTACTRSAAPAAAFSASNQVQGSAIMPTPMNRAVVPRRIGQIVGASGSTASLQCAAGSSFLLGIVGPSASMGTASNYDTPNHYQKYASQTETLSSGNTAPQVVYYGGSDTAPSPLSISFFPGPAGAMPYNNPNNPSVNWFPACLTGVTSYTMTYYSFLAAQPSATQFTNPIQSTLTLPQNLLNSQGYVYVVDQYTSGNPNPPRTGTVPVFVPLANQLAIPAPQQLYVRVVYAPSYNTPAQQTLSSCVVSAGSSTTSFSNVGAYSSTAQSLLNTSGALSGNSLKIQVTAKLSDGTTFSLPSTIGFKSTPLAITIFVDNYLVYNVEVRPPMYLPGALVVVDDSQFYTS